MEDHTMTIIGLLCAVRNGTLATIATRFSRWRRSTQGWQLGQLRLRFVWRRWRHAAIDGARRFMGRES
jgi:hypothetical protein